MAKFNFKHVGPLTGLEYFQYFLYQRFKLSNAKILTAQSIRGKEEDAAL